MINQLKVMIVDDHSLFREGLRFLLSQSALVETIEEAADASDFLAQLNVYKPDVVLMDIELPGMNGIEASQKALEREPDLNIIALSMYADECYYTEMIEAGAKGFLLKNSRFEDVEKAISDVVNGKNYFSPEILSSIVQNLNRKTGTIKNIEITKREMEVLIHICQGYSNQAIGDKLHISKRTVDKHRENILLKTGTGNTAELVVYAIRNGYFEV